MQSYWPPAIRPGIFFNCCTKKKEIHAKPFALGLRVEHPQELIDSIQYHYIREEGSHGLSRTAPGILSACSHRSRPSVFSFCMCPGGIIAPASTRDGELVVNGWSPSKRNNPFANSGIVVNIQEKDWQAYKKQGPLAAMYFQSAIEQKAFALGGGSFKAPAQRLTDFAMGTISGSLPACSYTPGLTSVNVPETFPNDIAESLQRSFAAFGKKMKGYFTRRPLLLQQNPELRHPYGYREMKKPWHIRKFKISIPVVKVPVMREVS